MKRPNFAQERELMGLGHQYIIGVDEVGCGALAGPVIAGAVFLPLNSRLGEIRDSKQLSKQKREDLSLRIQEKTPFHAIGEASVSEIGEFGLRNAIFLAMRRAISQIKEAEFILVDGYKIRELSLPQRVIIKGDQKVKSIAAASILAKVHRDRIMEEMDEIHPEYGFARHVGYATKAHKEAIKTYGPCKHHRLTYKMFS